MQDHDHRLLHAINHLNQRIEHMTLVWERLEAKVAGLKTVEDSLIALLKEFFAASKDAVQNAKDLAEAQTKIDGLEADAQGQIDKMAAAVQANTPGGPANPPVPTDPTTGAPVDPSAPVNDPSVDPSTLRSSRRR
jgi:hypothetical protein